MKISGLTIQDKKININTDSDFVATYKGKKIVITTFHNLGLPVFSHLFRYSIIVTDIKTGTIVVEKYDDCHDMKDAIRSALKDSGLLT